MGIVRKQSFEPPQAKPSKGGDLEGIAPDLTVLDPLRDVANHCYGAAYKPDRQAGRSPIGRISVLPP